MDSQLFSIKVVSGAGTNKNDYHTPYRDEIRIFSCVKDGDIKRLYEEIKSHGNNGIFVGQMSEDNITQYKYMAVSAVTLATRYAIQGGLGEIAAYGFSDSFIKDIDTCATSAEIIDKLISSILQLTKLVGDSKKNPKYSPHVRKCILYINKNLCRKLTVKEIAKHCGLSADYLSNLFKSETDENLSAYILRLKLEAAQTLLFEGYSNKSICEKLGFSSQSYFITAFKKQYEQTPNEYGLLFKKE